MDRRMLHEHLATAFEHVSLGESSLRRQRRVVAELERDGHDTVTARQLLDRFEALQALHVSERDRLLRRLQES